MRAGKQWALIRVCRIRILDDACACSCDACVVDMFLTDEMGDACVAATGVHFMPVPYESICGLFRGD